MKLSVKSITQYIAFALLFSGASLLIGKYAFNYAVLNTSELSTQAGAEAQQLDFIIDPGHGGEDGGATSGDVLEKNLNLAISENLCDLYAVFGYNARTTRTDDTLLYDYYNDLEDYKGRKKTYDLRNRLRIAEESGAKLYVGIHMNKFPQEKYKGLQVYYSPNDEKSRDAASMIQSYAKKFIMPDNEREIKQATQAIYILKRIKIPAVLVECGFLSNPEELALLTSKDYRLKLSAALFASSAEFIVTE